MVVGEKREKGKKKKLIGWKLKEMEWDWREMDKMEWDWRDWEELVGMGGMGWGVEEKKSGGREKEWEGVLEGT